MTEDEEDNLNVYDDEVLAMKHTLEEVSGVINVVRYATYQIVVNTTIETCKTILNT